MSIFSRQYAANFPIPKDVEQTPSQEVSLAVALPRKAGVTITQSRLRVAIKTVNHGNERKGGGSGVETEGNNRSDRAAKRYAFIKQKIYYGNCSFTAENRFCRFVDVVRKGRS